MAQAEYSCLNLPCPQMPEADSEVWHKVPVAKLVDVVSGQPPRLATSFQMFRDDAVARFYVRFAGEDDGIQSSFTMHDEPLYREDVLELFIADENRLDRYKELQVSPWDLHFDGLITYDDQGQRSLDMTWDVAGWHSRSCFDLKARRMASVWSLPYAAFAGVPKKGTSWRFNAFRIDHGPEGQSLQAWQKTGVANFHVPERFGYLMFVD